MEQIIAKGAEAILVHKDDKLIKKRIKKSYRIQILDEKLRKSRTKKESKLLEKASKFIPTPKIISSNENNKEIIMEFINGKKLSTHLDSLPNAIEICNTIGKQIALLHDNDIIHGDLTTSNMILSKENKVYFIDFGLGFESKKPEDKAVDLHLIKQALEAKHFQNYKEFFSAILEGYKISKHHSLILNRLKKVEARGRYKQQTC
ncbi:MAG: KEOPS complex kinase/ATPase Bud32 [Candidatus Pacearchaeota archaeon]|nr:KEOPS complex kinase/ATPase Bud32 [Candidatus Pacearchaeota archaeon]